MKGRAAMADEDNDRPGVIVIDGDGDVRSLLEAMLEVTEDFRLLGVAEDADTGIELAAALQPDAIVFDLDLPQHGGAQILPLLRVACPGSRIIVFSATPDPLTLVEVLRHGADEYIDKARAWADLLPTMALLCGAARTA